MGSKDSKNSMGSKNSKGTTEAAGNPNRGMAGIWFRRGMLAAACFCLAVSLFVLLRYYVQGQQEEAKFNLLRDMVVGTDTAAGMGLGGTGDNDGESGAEIPVSEDGIPIEMPAARGLDLALAQGQNSDIAAWIYIPDTKVDYPVMYTPYAPGYYLNHDWDKGSSHGGVPYLDERSILWSSPNLIAYGHNMKNGSMFADLLRYEDADFYREHSIIYLYTPQGTRSYQVVAAFAIDAEKDADILNYTNSSHEEDFNRFRDEVERRSLHEGGQLTFGDRLLTLCTCEYTNEDGRFLVIAKEMAEAVSP